MTLSTAGPARALLPLAIALCGGCVGLTDADRARLDVFDTYWEALDESYPFFGRKGIDWKEVGTQYRSAVAFAEEPHDFYHLLAGMLSELGDLHISLSVPAKNLSQDGVPASSVRNLPGFDYIYLGGRMFVTSWPEGQDPVRPDHLLEGESLYPELVAVEGFPVVGSLVSVLWKGPPGSVAELSLRWTDGTLGRHQLRRPPPREEPAGASEVSGTIHLRRKLPASSHLHAERFVHLVLPTFDLEREEVEAVDQLIDAALPHEGLILDLRNNGGGYLGASALIAGRFLTEDAVLVFGLQENAGLLPLLDVHVFSSMQLVPQEPIYTGPLVVLTTQRTGSAAETCARILQREAGAVVVGERTAGAEANLRSVKGQDGSVLKFGSERMLDSKGRGLQGLGVLPDHPVSLRLEDVERLGAAAATKDFEERLMQAALTAIEEQIQASSASAADPE